jgi:hypothetical protein
VAAVPSGLSPTPLKKTQRKQRGLRKCEDVQKQEYRAVSWSTQPAWVENILQETRSEVFHLIFSQKNYSHRHIKTRIAWLVIGVSVGPAASIFKVERLLPDHAVTQYRRLKANLHKFDAEFPNRSFLIPGGASKLQSPEGHVQFNATRLFALLVVVAA